MPELGVAPVFSDESGRRAAAVQWAGRSVTAGALATMVALAVILSTSSVPLPRLPEPWSPAKPPSRTQLPSHAGVLPDPVAVPDPGPAARVRAFAAVQAVAVPARKAKDKPKATKSLARTPESNAKDAGAAGTASRAVPTQSRRARASTGAPVQADGSPPARRPRTAPASPPPARPVAPTPPRNAPSDKAPRTKTPITRTPSTKTPSTKTPRTDAPRTRTPGSRAPASARPPASRPVGASRRPSVQPAPSAGRDQPARPGPDDRAAKASRDDGAARPVPGPASRPNS